jgi:hypothetical protein
MLNKHGSSEHKAPFGSLYLGQALISRTQHSQAVTLKEKGGGRLECKAVRNEILKKKGKAIVGKVVISRV